MCGSNYANFELDLGKKVLNLLKVRPWEYLLNSPSVIRITFLLLGKKRFRNDVKFRHYV
jgi:hypothetical protein